MKRRRVAVFFFFVAATLLAISPAASHSPPPVVAQAAGAPRPAAQLARWPSFRGPGASGVVDGAELPVDFGRADATGLSWRTPIPGMAHASPIVWGDRIYVTSVVGSGPPQRFLAELPDSPESVVTEEVHRWLLLALDRLTGEVLWQRTAAEGVPGTGRLRKGTFNNSTPATDGAHIVALFGSQGLFCYDVEGNLLWRVDLGLLDAGWFFDPASQWGTASSPIIWDGRVIVQADVRGGAFLAAFDLQTGAELWRAARDEASSWATPTVVQDGGRVEIVTNGGRAIRAYDPANGAELWTLSPSSEIAVPTPVFAHGLIFVGAGYLPRQPFYAVRPGGNGDISLGGDQRASRQIAWSMPTGAPFISTPIVVGDYLYLLARDGTLSCFDARTGIPIYAERIDAPSRREGLTDEGGATGGESGAGAAAPAYSASPVASNGKLYVAAESGDIHVIEAGPFLRLVATNPIGEATFATPAIAGGMLIVRAKEHIYAFSR